VFRKLQKAEPAEAEK